MINQKNNEKKSKPYFHFCVGLKLLVIYAVIFVLQMILNNSIKINSIKKNSYSKMANLFFGRTLSFQLNPFKNCKFDGI